MPQFAIQPDQIRRVTADRILGRQTTTGSAEELSATDAKTLLGLGSSDSPTFDDITATGQVFVPSGTSVNPSLCFTGAVQKRIGFYEVSADWVIGVATGGALRHAFGSSYIATRSTSSFAWSSTTDPSSTRDLTLYRDDAGALAQRNGTNSQAFRIYNTDDGSQTNYERGSIGWDSNVFTIGTQAAGTGTLRNVHVVGANLALPAQTELQGWAPTFTIKNTGGVSRDYLWNIDTSGNMSFKDSASAYYWKTERIAADLFLQPTAVGKVGIGKDTAPSTMLDVAGDLTLENGTTATSAYVYNTGSGSDYERGFLKWDSSTFKIGTEAAGTGTARDLVLATGGTEAIKIAGSNQRITIPNLPTSDPASAGELWNDSGTLKISAG